LESHLGKHLECCWEMLRAHHWVMKWGQRLGYHLGYHLGLH